VSEFILDFDAEEKLGHCTLILVEVRGSEGGRRMFCRNGLLFIHRFLVRCE
jgi:hypothetical protein